MKISTIKKGKVGELIVASKMAADGLDVYMPVADDGGIDFVVVNKHGKFNKVQVKTAGETKHLTVAVDKHKPKKDFWFVLHCTKPGMEGFWLLTSKEYCNVARKGGTEKKPSLVLHLSQEKTLNDLKDYRLRDDAGRVMFKRLVDDK